MIEFIVEDEGPTRLDKFIRRKFIYLSQGIIEKYLRTGQVRVNQRKVQAGQRVSRGDILTIAENIIRESAMAGLAVQKKSFSSSVIAFAEKLLPEHLIFSCEEFIAIDKPYGLAVQGGSKINLSVDHALSYLNAATGSDYKLVHRLDKDTSGILLIARTLKDCNLLGKAFRERTLKKTYLAITSRAPSAVLSNDTIKSYIAKKKSGIYETVKETEEGKFASTSYEILASNKEISAIKYTPLTGRMHQLRFHSQQLGCPILGDNKYGGIKFARMMLHAFEMEIPANIFGKKYIIRAPLDRFFTSCLSKLNLEI